MAKIIPTLRKQNHPLCLGPKSPKTIFEASLDTLVKRVIQTGQHCFGCTAGLGSS
jgi:uncharacterized protein DUF3641